MDKEKKYHLTGAIITPNGDEFEQLTRGVKTLTLAIKVEIDGKENESCEKSRIKVKSSITDIVRIFEAMKDAEIISGTKTETLQLAELFFTETLDKKKFEAAYNARKNDTVARERNSNSTALAKFIKILIRSSFSKKEIILSSIADEIDRMQGR